MFRGEGRERSAALSLFWHSVNHIIKKKIPLTGGFVRQNIRLMDDVIINCDWLQYSVMLQDESPEFISPAGFRIEFLQGNNIFRHRALIFDAQGRKWLTLLWSPFSSLLNRRIMSVQVANLLLYYDSIQVSFKLLQQIVDCEFNSCGRVDVCCDFQITENQIEVIKHLNSGHYYVQGKSEGSNWWHKVTEVGGDRIYKRNQTHCLSWGSSSSDIKVKCYHKSRELGMLNPNPEPEKPYIVDMWRAAGWDVTRVWRLEFSLCGSGKLRWDNEVIDLDKVKSKEWLQHLFYNLYGRRFVVRENQGRRDGHKNTDPLRTFLSLPSDGSVLSRSLGALSSAPASPAVKLLRSLMGQLSSPAVMASSDSCYALCSAISAVVEVHHLRSYFSAHFGDDVEPYLQKIMDSSGEGCYEVDGNPTKCWM